MKLQILILTQKSRREFLEQLISLFEPQIALLGVRKFDHVDIMVREDSTLEGKQVGDKRESLRQRSDGEYIAFFDDDDLPASDYISRILPQLDGADTIGFECQLWNDRQRDPKRDFHTIKSVGWFNTPTSYHRDISHLQPMRREVALAAPMEGGYGEDRRWAERMRALGVVKTENYVDSVLYYYLMRTRKDDAKDPHHPWRLEMVDRIRGEIKAAAR
jgi:glycosyltransferase involved in cell wall biosynthesis